MIDYLIIGGGIIGLSLAIELKKNIPTNEAGKVVVASDTHILGVSLMVLVMGYHKISQRE